MAYMRLGMAMFERKREPIYQPADVEIVLASVSTLNLAGSEEGHGLYSSTGSSSISAADLQVDFLYNESMEGLLIPRANEAKAREDASFNMLRSLSKATGKKINDYTYCLMLHEESGMLPGRGNDALATRVHELEAEKQPLWSSLRCYIESLIIDRHAKSFIITSVMKSLMCLLSLTSYGVC
ncbi:hypothetical protein PIB30_022175 [Stylosanthes scabra]|uniref:Uncharacterized protein n=1 Tax=Stylosanthes scabra TaxID=79078 RepID=A0ABU6W958_9FABA|nr:hypothetical protein [Stylosanthes scabra]